MVDQVLCTLFRQREAPLLYVVEHVFALHVVQHYEVGIAVFEQIDQLDDIVVLAHFEDLDLTALLEDFDRLHVGLLDRLDCDMRSGHLVLSLLDKAKLAFAESLAKLIEVEQVSEAHSLQQHLHPALLLVHRVEVQDAGLVRWQHDFNWIEGAIGLRAALLRNLFHKCTGETVHYPAAIVSSATVAENFVSVEHRPVLLESIGFGL